MKNLILVVIVALLLGGIIGTSLNVFNSGRTFINGSATNIIKSSYDDKLSMRQIDSLSASSNLTFTIKNALR